MTPLKIESIWKHIVFIQMKKGYRVHRFALLRMELDEVLDVPDVGDGITISPLQKVCAGLNNFADDEGSLTGGVELVAAFGVLNPV